eukprot:5518490-Amphidinium_carterae.1
MNTRLRRELITLGEALDLLMSGSLDKVGDLLMQRIKALELSVREGTWERAGHLEVAGQRNHGLTSMSERTLVAKQQRLERQAAGSGVLGATAKSAPRP